MASAAPSIGTQVASFVVNLAASYLIGRVMAQDAPKLDNLAAAGGDYGIPMARAYGGAVRLTGSFIGQEDIRRRTHKVEDHSEIIGAIGGAVQGFQIGGPVGAVIGGAIGGLLGFATPDQKYYTYDCTFGLFLVDRTFDDPVEGILKLWANGKTIFNGTEEILEEKFDADGRLIRRKYGKNKYLKSLTLYTGHEDQDVDPIAADNWDETSGNIFSCYIVLHELQLAFAGNSVPPVEGLVQVKTNESLAEAAESICAAAGFDTEREVSTTALTGYLLQGYALTSETTCWDALKPLLPVFGVDAAEVSGQVRFYRRSQSMRAVIPTDQMGSYMFGDSAPEKFLFKRDNDLSLPQETSLTFVDPARDYQPNTATSSRTEGDANSNVAVTIPVVLSASEGASAVALMHWDAWLGRTALSFTLTDQWMGIEAGLAYGIPFAGQVLPYRITRKLRGANGIIEVEALSDESVTYTANVAGSSGTLPDDEDTTFPETRLVIIDGPLLSDSHDDYGYYVVMGGGAGWTRGRVEISDDGVTFVRVIDQPYSAVMGDVTGTLAAGSTTGLDDTLDTTTVLTVETLHSEMEFVSATDAELDSWKNFGAVVNDGVVEYLQWKTATQVGPTTWQLTNLRRGRRGTDWAIGLHSSGAQFADLTNGDGVYRIVYGDTSEWGNEFTFRGVTLHQDEADADTQTFTNTGEGKRPFSPVNVEGSWDGSNNLTVTCDLRSRLFAGGLGIDDNNETEWEFFGSPNHTETVSGDTVVFSAAEQTAAGATPGDTVTGRVRQTSDVNDGRWRNFTIIGPNALTFDSSLTFDETSFTWDAG